MRLLPIIPFLVSVFWVRAAPLSGNPNNEEEIRSILLNAVHARRTVGIVIGMIDANGIQVYSQGKTIQEGKDVDGDSVFEIGSVTKTLTATLLADMVLRREVNLNDPISKFLPPSIKLPRRGQKEITLLDLATHTSGLPRMPSNFDPRDPENPYIDYSVEKLYEYLSGCGLTRDIGEKYEYSNLGYGLLGQILSLRAGMSYESLVTERIFKPLGMTNSAITLTPEMRSRLAAGHSRLLTPVKNWDFSALAGAGGIRSTVNDMLRYVSANMGLKKSELSAAMIMTQEIQKPTTIADTGIGLGWHVVKQYNSEITQHNGGTGGYHSYLGFDRRKSVGVVVFSNSPHSIDDVGMHLLNPQFLLTKFVPPEEHKEIKIDPNILDVYVGDYQMIPSMLFTVSKENETLHLQATGQQKVALHPESETEFFMVEADAQVTFMRDASGKVTHLVLHQSGANPIAQKIR